jgi:hypothetical protein
MYSLTMYARGANWTYLREESQLAVGSKMEGLQ